MALFDDMTNEVATYPVNNVTLEIVDVTFPGSVLNTREEGTFRVKVSNKGPLNLNNVKVRITGKNGATVAGNGAVTTFVSELVTLPMATIGGHVGTGIVPDDPTRPLKFKAPQDEQGRKTLLAATIDAWDADFDHMLVDHSDPLPDAPKGLFESEVAAK